MDYWKRMKASAAYWITAALWLNAMVTCSQSDSSWKDQSLVLQHPSDESAEQQMIQAQEMANYHKRLASMSLSDAQRITQIDLTQSDSHVTAQVGHPAYLKCAVSNLGDQLVPTDLGLLSHQVQLEVLVPDVFILGPKDLIVDRGTTLSLVCIVENSPIPPQFVFWYHNDKLLNYQPKRDGVLVETEYGSRTHSKLEVKNALETDTGNYTCSTSSGKPYSIYVQVLAGDQAAAMSRKNAASESSQLALVHLLTCFLHLTAVWR